MKRMKQILSLATAMLIVISAITITALAANSSAQVSVRIEGINGSLYSNESLTVSYDEVLTVRDVIDSLKYAQGAPVIRTDSNSNAYITEINGISAGSYNGRAAWGLSVNGRIISGSTADQHVMNGDDIVIFVYDGIEGIMIPRIDMTLMMTEYSIKFTDQNGKAIVGAHVMWDGMDYTTDHNGKIIVDSTGIGVEHAVQIDMYQTNGLPAVLRFKPEHTVTAMFEDVKDNAWYRDAVMFVVNYGLFQGDSATTFSPEKNMNRAMFVTVLGRLAGAVVDNDAEVNYSDINYDGWSTGYVAWASENEYVTGYDDGTFRQYNTVSREQIATILYRYAENSGYIFPSSDDALDIFPDSDTVSDYAVNAMRWAVSNGIITGSSGNLNPQGTASRAQVATMLMRTSILIDSYDDTDIDTGGGTEDNPDTDTDGGTDELPDTVTDGDTENVPDTNTDSNYDSEVTE